MTYAAVLPVGWSGDFTVLGRSNSRDEIVRAAELLEAALRSKAPRSIGRTASVVEFRAGLFRAVSSWNVLAPITRGRVEVLPSTHGISVRYQIQFTEMLVATTIIATLFALSPHGPPGHIYTVIWAWFWLFGGNLVICLVRFPRFLRRALSEQTNAV